MAENMSKVINDYKVALRNTGASTSIQMLKIAKNLYDCNATALRILRGNEFNQT